MKRQYDTQALDNILDRDNTAEVKLNKAGDVVIMEVKKKIVSTIPKERD